MRKIFTLAIVSFKEIIRQPIYIIVLLIAMAMLYASPWFSMFTLLNSSKLVRDMGLATILLSVLFISAFSASGLIFKEIENKTAVTVLSKPVFRFQFLIGKYIGLLFGISLAVIQLTLFLILIMRIGVPETAQFTLDKPVVYSLEFIFVFSLLWAAVMNYFFDKPFTSSLVIAFFYFLLLVFFTVSFINPDFQPQNFGAGMELGLFKAGILIFLSMSILGSIAIIGSIRFNMISNLVFCIAIFFTGMTADYFFGRFADSNIVCKIIYSIIPNLQFFWTADAFLTNNTIPSSYIVLTSLYTVIYIPTALVFGWFLFTEREIS
ncbi:hypothetical protein J7L67_07510 [bacterium]|nr:hypothetical protein [bacterium]